MKKYSRQISIDTLKQLLARSGNQCAYPNCSHPIFNDQDLLVAQLCHIQAVSPNGQRHNPNLTDKETNSYDNLLFLCYRHHKETDDVERFPVNKLREIKDAHETKFKENGYNYSEVILNELIKDTNLFWQQIEELHKDHIIPNLSVPIEINSDIPTLISEIDSNLIALRQVSQILMSECKPTHFELVCLALPNLISLIGVAIDQIEIKYIEELILKNPESEGLKNKLKILRDQFAVTAQYAGLAD
jgi:hypothetical protein